MHKSKQRKNPVNASLTTTTATATILGIILMIPSLFVAGTGEQGGINAYGQITPPSQLQEHNKEEEVKP